MQRNPIASWLKLTSVHALFAAALAMAIFVIDTATTLDIAIAVLYVFVVLLAANFLPRRGVLMVASACLVLTVLSYFFSHGLQTGAAFARCLVSLAAIVITTLLALRYQVATGALRSQAELLDLTHDAIFVRDMDDVITYWNRGAENLYDRPREQALGMSTHQLLQTVFPGPLASINEELLRTGRWEGELVHCKRDGTPVTVESRWALQRDARGQPRAVLETNTDISERKRQQEKIREMHAELAHVTRVATLGELTASIAHEVNQPLAGIVTNGEACLRWLGRDEPQLDEAQSAVERMISDGRRASEVVRRLRALASKGVPQRLPVNLNDIVDEAIPLVQRELSNHRITLKLELALHLPPVRGDRIQLQQVLINLMVNGIQAMSAVSLGRRALTIESQQVAEGVRVAVQDSGVGLDAVDIDRLFDAFFSTKPDGMGMGLSICRSIIESHGGRIEASRNEGPGATFQFVLPVEAHGT